CGNSSICDQTITITCPPDITVECTTPNPNGNPEQAGASIGWTAVPGLTYDHPNPSFFVHGTTTTITGTSASGAVCKFTVHVNDNCPDTCTPTAIMLFGCPAPDGGSYQCLGDVRPSTATVTAMDNCGNVVPVVPTEM